MFSGSRRRRPPPEPLNSATANPNATTAAASAFMSAASQNPNKALSSAAAAAALRARPHTPTNVAQVQTKRTARRSASVSSSGSAPAGTRLSNGHGKLERRGSTSSMTERTFRTPSPHRSPTSTTQEPQPPVPRIPDSHKNSAVNTRAAGVGMQNFRTASQKMGSEPHSYYVQPTGDVSNVRKSDSIMRMTKSPPPARPNVVTAQPSRPDSRSSVNFSYPTAFRPQSPPVSPISPSKSDVKVASPNSSRGPSSNAHMQSGQQLVYDPNSRRMVPKAHVEEEVEYQIKQVADKPPKKRKDGTLRREGSQLAKGTVARARGTMVDENKGLREPPKQEQPVAEALSSTKETPPEEEPRAKSVITTESLDQSQPVEPSGSVSRSLSPSTHITSNEQGGRFELDNSAQRPIAIVPDEPQVNDDQPKTENHSKPSQTPRDMLDAIPTRQVLAQQPHPPKPSQEPDIDDVAEGPHPSSTIEKLGVSETNMEQKAVPAESKSVVELKAERSDPRRSNSNSPARQARFAPGPAENLAVRHAPLPRSASPIKSAMKHNNLSPRDTSPSENTSDPSGSSAVSPVRGEEPAISRKKSVRVSFDDHSTVVVGDSAPPVGEDSPPSQSSQGHKRTWFSNIGRSKKKEVALDDDEIMKPRPALPSFGSIREKKLRDLGERPLVRPLEPAYSPAVSSSPELRPQSSSTLNDSETTEEPSLGQSSDHAIGALLAQDQTSRNAANISRFREPLPPVVTSIEGSGYSSDSFQGSDDEDQANGTIEAGITGMDSSVPSTQLTRPDIDDSSQDPFTALDTASSKKEEHPETPTGQQPDIPEISVIQPSPMRVEHDSRANGSSTPYFDVPGGFPDYGSDISSDSQAKTTRDSAGSAIFEPITTTIDPDQAGLLPQTTLNTTTPVASLKDSTEDESDESVYSDAYEDIPDFDPGGFMSLDAVVESPISKESKPGLPQTLEGSSAQVITSEPKPDAIPEGRSVSKAQLTPPQDADDWEQAKAFWRSLTAEKRRQLELEAAEEAGAEGDREEVSQPIRRNSSRRKTPEPMQPIQGKSVQSESHMRMSLRDEQGMKSTTTQPQTGMRKTMRSNGGSQNAPKFSTRQAASTKAPAPTTSKSNRNQVTKSRSHSMIQATSGSQPTTQAKPTLQRRGSDASDSSFKRSRASPSKTVAFRKTMRQTSPTQPHRSTNGSGRFSLRSLSPAGSTVYPESHTGFATHSPGGMRRTLRSNSESSHEGKRSSVHFPLFTRSAKSSTKTSRWSSRFDDSSDEERRTSVGYLSRLGDSSDEEDSRPAPSKESQSLGKATLRTSATAPSLSRPATVPEIEEDSPELPDSDDDLMSSPLQSPQSKVAERDFASRLATERRNSGAIGTSTLGRSRSGRGGLTPSFTSPELPAKDKRGSLLSRLRRSKRSDQTGKIQRSELVDSAARRDTRLERDRGQLKDLRSEQPSSPKLQKRMSVSRSGSGGLQRPTSAGNLFGRNATTGATERPTLSDRRSLSLGPNPNTESYEIENASVESPSVLKKKKFGALRRMFKLDE